MRRLVLSSYAKSRHPERRPRHPELARDLPFWLSETRGIPYEDLPRSFPFLATCSFIREIPRKLGMTMCRFLKLGLVISVMFLSIFAFAGPLSEGEMRVFSNTSDQHLNELKQQPDKVFFMFKSHVSQTGEGEAQRTKLTLHAMTGQWMKGIQLSSVEEDDDASEILPDIFQSLCDHQQSSVLATLPLGRVTLSASEGEAIEGNIDDSIEYLISFDEARSAQWQASHAASMTDSGFTLAVMSDQACRSDRLQQELSAESSLYFFKLHASTLIHLQFSQTSLSAEALSQLNQTRLITLSVNDEEKRAAASSAFAQLAWQLSAHITRTIKQNETSFAGFRQTIQSILTNTNSSQVITTLRAYELHAPATMSENQQVVLPVGTFRFSDGTQSLLQAAEGTSFPNDLPCASLSNASVESQIALQLFAEDAKLTHQALNTLKVLSKWPLGSNESAQVYQAAFQCGAAVNAELFQAQKETAHGILLWKPVQGQPQQSQLYLGTATFSEPEIPPPPITPVVLINSTQQPSDWLPSLPNFSAPIVLTAQSYITPIETHRVDVAATPGLFWMTPAHETHAAQFHAIPYAIQGATFNTLHVDLPQTAGSEATCRLEAAVQSFPILKVKVGNDVKWLTAILCGPPLEVTGRMPPRPFYLVNLSDASIVRCGEQDDKTLFYLKYHRVRDENGTRRYQTELICEAPTSRRVIQDPIRSVSGHDQWLMLATTYGTQLRLNLGQLFTREGGQEKRTSVLSFHDGKLHLDPSTFIYPANAQRFQRIGRDFRYPAENNRFLGISDSATLDLNKFQQFFLEHPEGVGPILGDVKASLPMHALEDDLSLVVETPCSLCQEVKRSTIHRQFWTDIQGQQQKGAFQLLPFSADEVTLQHVQSDSLANVNRWLTQIRQQAVYPRTHRFDTCQWGDADQNDMCNVLKNALPSMSFAKLTPDAGNTLQSQIAALLLADQDIAQLKDAPNALVITGGSEVRPLSSDCRTLVAQFNRDPRLWRVVDFVAWFEGLNSRQRTCFRQVFQETKIDAYRRVVFTGASIIQSAVEKGEAPSGLPLGQVLVDSMQQDADVLVAQLTQFQKQASHQAQVVGHMKQTSEQDASPQQVAWFAFSPEDILPTLPASENLPQFELLQHLHYGIQQRGYGFSPHSFWRFSGDRLQAMSRNVMVNGFRQPDASDETPAKEYGYEYWNRYTGAGEHVWVPQSRSTYHYRSRSMARDQLETFLNPAVNGNSQRIWQEGSLIGHALLWFLHGLKTKLYAIHAGQDAACRIDAISQLPSETLDAIFEGLPSVDRFSAANDQHWRALLTVAERIKWSPGIGTSNTIKPSVYHIFESYLKSIIYDKQSSFISDPFAGFLNVLPPRDFPDPPRGAFGSMSDIFTLMPSLQLFTPATDPERYTGAFWKQPAMINYDLPSPVVRALKRYSWMMDLALPKGDQRGFESVSLSGAGCSVGFEPQPVMTEIFQHDAQRAINWLNGIEIPEVQWQASDQWVASVAPVVVIGEGGNQTLIMLRQREQQVNLEQRSFSRYATNVTLPLTTLPQGARVLDGKMQVQNGVILGVLNIQRADQSLTSVLFAGEPGSQAIYTLEGPSNQHVLTLMIHPEFTQFCQDAAQGFVNSRFTRTTDMPVSLLVTKQGNDQTTLERVVTTLSAIKYQTSWEAAQTATLCGGSIYATYLGH